MIYSVTDIESGYDKDNETCWGNVPIKYIKRNLCDEIKGFGKVKNCDNNESTSRYADGCTNMEFIQIYKNMRALRDNKLGTHKVWNANTNDRHNKQFLHGLMV